MERLKYLLVNIIRGNLEKSLCAREEAELALKQARVTEITACVHSLPMQVKALSKKKPYVSMTQKCCLLTKALVKCVV